jgi:AcrR family transcriptional regulator
MATLPRSKTGRPIANHPRLLVEKEVGDTKTKILDAAFRRLAQEGYTALSVREIAKDAGVNHALINYHFRTKDQLVIAVLDEANRQLLDRQQRMYAEPGGFAQKWAQARRFYQNDLASGFVRVQAELWAASLSNPELRAKFLPRLLAWKQVVLGAVRDALATLSTHDVTLPQPLTAEVIATWISEFWLGMEFADLLGAPEERLPHRAALDAMQHLLEELDARVQKLPASPRRRDGVAKGATRTRK